MNRKQQGAALIYIKKKKKGYYIDMEGKKEQFMSEGKRPSLEDFQHEIAGFSMREQRGEETSGHFLMQGIEARNIDPEFDPANLTEEDEAIWEKLNDGTITMDQLRTYANSISALDEKDLTKKSRVLFMQYVGNKAPLVIFKSGMKKIS